MFDPHKLQHFVHAPICLIGRKPQACWAVCDIISYSIGKQLVLRMLHDIPDV